MKRKGEQMSKLYGFKYTVYRFMVGYIEYIILSESDGKYYIDKYCNGTKHHFNVTDKIDTFCNEIKGLDIEKWNMNSFNSSIDWTPPADYRTFQINTDELSVSCMGDVFSSNWKEFWKAFNRICNNR